MNGPHELRFPDDPGDEPATTVTFNDKDTVITIPTVVLEKFGGEVFMIVSAEEPDRVMVRWDNGVSDDTFEKYRLRLLGADDGGY